MKYLKGVAPQTLEQIHQQPWQCSRDIRRSYRLAMRRRRLTRRLSWIVSACATVIFILLVVDFQQMQVDQQWTQPLQRAPMLARFAEQHDDTTFTQNSAETDTSNSLPAEDAASQAPAAVEDHDAHARELSQAFRGTSITTAPAPESEARDEVVYFNGREIRPVRTIRMRVTGYCPCRKCCGKHADGKTASGYTVAANGSKFVAADTSVLPFGSLVAIEGYAGGEPVPVLDRGRVIKGNRIDLFFRHHSTAKRYGVKYLDVTVWDYVD